MNITLLAKKGGVGKSTLSILLYEAFRQAGKSVSLKDWDAQGTSSKALELILGAEIAAKQPPKPDIIIYDTPPSLEHTATATAVLNADIVLVVTSPPLLISGKRTTLSVLCRGKTATLQSG